MNIAKIIVVAGLWCFLFVSGAILFVETMLGMRQEANEWVARATLICALILVLGRGLEEK